MQRLCPVLLKIDDRRGSIDYVAVGTHFDPAEPHTNVDELGQTYPNRFSINEYFTIAHRFPLGIERNDSDADKPGEIDSDLCGGVG